QVMPDPRNSSNSQSRLKWRADAGVRVLRGHPQAKRELELTPEGGRPARRVLFFGSFCSASAVVGYEVVLISCSTCSCLRSRSGCTSLACSSTCFEELFF